MGPHTTGVFVFTDIEGSTPRWEAEPEAMAEALTRHDQILRDAVAGHGGTVCKSTGDGILARFDRVEDAIRAMVHGQRGLEGIAVGAFGPLLVRMGAHVGEVEERGNDYFGRDINTAARLSDAGHGGQVLVSDEALRRCGGIDEDVTTADLGLFNLKGVSQPVRIHQVVADGLRAEFGPLRTEGAEGNLPQLAGGLIGRSLEQGELVDLVSDRPLVTIRGPGGVGKTRLALHVARQAATKCSLVPWLVDLSTLTDDEEVAPTVADLFGIRRKGGATLASSVAGDLSLRPVLLVLDNCEHVLAGANELATALVERGGRTVTLATSREPLGVAGEQQYLLEPLRTDGEVPAEAPSVELFVTRATEVVAGFELDDDRAADVAELCARLDGLPLAIELAAARVDVFDVRDLLGQIEHRLELRSRNRTRDAHRTIGATLDWSHRLLDEDHRILFRRLGAFADSFDIDLVMTVAGGDGIDPFDAAELLTDLVQKSLVVRRPGTHPTRFALLETARDYASTKLAEADEVATVRRRHAVHLADRMDQIAAAIYSEDAIGAIDRGMTLHREARSALSWAIDHDVDLTVQLAASLPALWKSCDLNEEALLLLTAVLDVLSDRPADRADVQSHRANFAFLVGDYRTTRAAAEDSISAAAIAGERPRGRAVARLCVAKVFDGEIDEAVDEARSELEHWRQHPGDFEACETIPVLHAALTLAGRPLDDGIDPAEECIRLAEPWGPMRLVPALVNGGVSVMHEDPERALALWRRQRSVESSGRWSTGSAAMMTIMTLVEVRRWEEARGEIARSLRSIHRANDPVRTISTVEVLAFTLADEAPTDAAFLLAACELERARVGTLGTPEERERQARTWTAIRRRLDENETDRLRTDVEDIDLNEVVDLAEAAALRFAGDHAP